MNLIPKEAKSLPRLGVGLIGENRIIEELFRFKVFMNEINEEFFLVGGLLLGAIREDGLLSHDKDLDFRVDGDAILYKMLWFEKFKYKYYDVAHIGSYGNGRNDKILWFKKYFNDKRFVLVIEISAQYKKDCFMFFNRDVGKSFKFREGRLVWNKDIFRPFKTYNLCGISLNIPNKSEEWLNVMYGKDKWQKEEKWVDWRGHTENLYEGYW